MNTSRQNGDDGFPLRVMIATHGRPKLLERTLESIAQCRLPANFQGVIVIENGGRLGAQEVVAAAPDRLEASYVFTPRGNKSHALNLGLEEVEKDALIVFFDDDVRVEENVLEEYVKAARQNRGCYFGGPTGVDYEKEPPQWLKSYLPASANGWECPESKRNRESLFFLGFNWACFERHLGTLGGFDENRGPGTGRVGQETEMQRRLIRGGVKPHYVPHAKVYHYVPEVRCSAIWMIQRAKKSARNTGKSLQPPIKSIRQRIRRVWWRCNPAFLFWRAADMVTGSKKAHFAASFWKARGETVVEEMTGGEE